jgi:hypothetical protein
MRASHIALILAVLAIPSVGYAQQDNGSVGGPVGGPVGGMVGPEGSSSPGQPRPSLGSPSGSPTRGGSLAGSTGSITAGQVGWRRVVVDGVPQNVRVTPRADGIGSAFINGQRVLVDLNTNRVLQQGNGPVGGSVGGPVGGSVGGSVGGPVGGSVGGPVGGSAGGPVGGLVGPGGSSSLGQPRPSRGSPYGSAPQGGSLAGSTGSITAGQVVPRNVPITNQYGGTGIAYINGQRVIVDTNTNRVLRPY